MICKSMGKMRNAYKLLLENMWERPLGRPKRR